MHLKSNNSPILCKPPRPSKQHKSTAATFRAGLTGQSGTDRIWTAVGCPEASRGAADHSFSGVSTFSCSLAPPGPNLAPPLARGGIAASEGATGNSRAKVVRQPTGGAGARPRRRVEANCTWADGNASGCGNRGRGGGGNANTNWQRRSSLGGFGEGCACAGRREGGSAQCQAGNETQLATARL